jgi:hypothetical protein
VGVSLLLLVLLLLLLLSLLFRKAKSAETQPRGEILEKKGHYQKDPKPRSDANLKLC